jgi:outer membrane protein assembly factor BamB
VYAIDAATGTQRWVAAPGYSFASPAVGADGTVYAAGGGVDGWTGAALWALDGASGTARWTLPLPGASYSSPAIGTGGTIYIGLQTGSLVAVGP